jgi:hypothetical protein
MAGILDKNIYVMAHCVSMAKHDSLDKAPLTLSVRTEYIYSVASQATSPAPFKYLFNKYPY